MKGGARVTGATHAYTNRRESDFGSIQCLSSSLRRNRTTWFR